VGGAGEGGGRQLRLYAPDASPNMRVGAPGAHASACKAPQHGAASRPTPAHQDQGRREPRQRAQPARAGTNG